MKKEEQVLVSRECNDFHVGVVCGSYIFSSLFRLAKLIFYYHLLYSYLFLNLHKQNILFLTFLLK